MKITIKEAIWIVVAISLMWIIVGISYDPLEKNLEFKSDFFFLLASVIIIFTNIIAKKIAAPLYSIKIEHNLWTLKRWGMTKKSYFKKPLPIGIVFPLLFSIFSLGYIKPMIFLQYKEENDYPRRILKKQGSRRAERKIEINEVDLAFVSSYGFYSLLLVSAVGIFLFKMMNIEFGVLLAKYSIFYGAWNLIPFGQLDGAKTFFGSPTSWTILTFFYLVALIIIVLI